MPRASRQSLVRTPVVPVQHVKIEPDLRKVKIEPGLLPSTPIAPVPSLPPDVVIKTEPGLVEVKDIIGSGTLHSPIPIRCHPLVKTEPGLPQNNFLSVPQYVLHQVSRHGSALPPLQASVYNSNFNKTQPRLPVLNSSYNAFKKSQPGFGVPALSSIYNKPFIRPQAGVRLNSWPPGLTPISIKQEPVAELRPQLVSSGCVYQPAQRFNQYFLTQNRFSSPSAVPGVRSNNSSGLPARKFFKLDPIHFPQREAQTMKSNFAYQPIRPAALNGNSLIYNQVSIKTEPDTIISSAYEPIYIKIEPDLSKVKKEGRPKNPALRLPTNWRTLSKAIDPPSNLSRPFVHSDHTYANMVSEVRPPAQIHLRTEQPQDTFNEKIQKLILPVPKIKRSRRRQRHVKKALKRLYSTRKAHTNPEKLLKALDKLGFPTPPLIEKLVIVTPCKGAPKQSGIQKHAVKLTEIEVSPPSPIQNLLTALAKVGAPLPAHILKLAMMALGKAGGSRRPRRSRNQRERPHIRFRKGVKVPSMNSKNSARARKLKTSRPIQQQSTPLAKIGIENKVPSSDEDQLLESEHDDPETEETPSLLENMMSDMDPFLSGISNSDQYRILPWKISTLDERLLFLQTIIEEVE